MTINTEADFAAFATQVNNGSLTLSGELQNDITLSTNADYLPVARDWKDVGMYAGDFNGNGHTITINLASNKGFLALFGTNNGVIHHLTVAGTVTLNEDSGTGTNGGDYIAGIVAYNDYNGKIERCVNKVTVTAKSTAAAQPEVAHNIGGIAGFNGWDEFSPDSPHAGQNYTQGTGAISQCRNEGNITGGFNKIGGIAGENASLIKECANTKKILCEKRAQDRGWPGVGGITGRNGNNNTAEEMGHILNCYNWGEIADNAATGTGQNAYGGITGWCDTVSTVKSCYTTGPITQGGSAATSGNVNPIIGMVDSDPQNTDNNYSLNTIFASSTDVELTGTRKLAGYMQKENFVEDLNDGSTGPYVFVSGNNYPKLNWEV